MKCTRCKKEREIEYTTKQLCTPCYKTEWKQTKIGKLCEKRYKVSEMRKKANIRNNSKLTTNTRRVYMNRYYESKENKYNNKIRKQTKHKCGRSPKGMQKHHYTQPYHVDYFVLVPFQKHYDIHAEGMPYIKLEDKEKWKNGIKKRKTL